MLYTSMCALSLQQVRALEVTQVQHAAKRNQRTSLWKRVQRQTASHWSSIGLHGCTMDGELMEGMATGATEFIKQWYTDR